jgi:hypothetical protein
MKILKFKEFLKAPDLSTREVGAIMLNKEVDPFRLNLQEKLFCSDFVYILYRDDFKSKYLHKFKCNLQRSIDSHTTRELVNAREKLKTSDVYKAVFEDIPYYKLSGQLREYLTWKD